MVDQLPQRLAKMGTESTSPNRIVLQGGGYRAVIRLDRDDVAQRWLLTAYEKADTPAPAEYRRVDADRRDGSPTDEAPGDIAPTDAADNAAASPIEGFDHPDDVAAGWQIDSGSPHARG